ncbi:MAG TPA: molybdopterin oxidoreductase [Campylobacterales bacterium]|nr:molybdopterin oxidoreductase [Campylobacterales bacterium]
MKKTTCPLDCFDACSVIYENGKLKGDKEHPTTQGYLCPNLNSYLKTPRIENPRYKGEEISMDKALEILEENLESTHDKPSLYFKGQGNFGKMQDITSLFFKEHGATFTRGSLCDGAGEAGIIEGRGASLSLPFEEIAKAEVVVVWGRNIQTTNSHIYPYIKDKIIVVIDPVETEIAKKSDLFLQIKPRSDLFVAVLMARFAYIDVMEDEEFIEERGDEWDYFVDFIRSYPMKKLMRRCGIPAVEIITALLLIQDRKTVFLVGVGVQKYSHGHSVLRMIDSFAAMMGKFGKEGCGVSYLGNSGFGFENPFVRPKKTVPIPTVDFGAYDSVFIQGANPANQMPRTEKVIEGLKKSKFVTYFGLYENETSQLADLVIPAKNFLEKEDVRFSYGHQYVGAMPKLEEGVVGICEYDLTARLMEKFGYEKLEDSSTYIEKIVNSNARDEGDYKVSKSYDTIPYHDKFYTDDEKFIFLDEIDDDGLREQGFHLITSKHKHSLNSQFKRAFCVHLPPSAGFSDGDRVRCSSKYGAFEFEVKVDDTLRDDSLLIYSGTHGVNYLTPDKLSEEGDSAVFQDVKVQVDGV